MNEKRLKRCCFTGHRPEKLNMPEQEVKQRLKKAIECAIDNGFTTFISGMARGVDMWAAEIVLTKKALNNDIKLIAASPFPGFEKSWDLSERQRYNYILEKADYVKFVCDKYSKICFHIRNKFMVDHSKRVIAFFNGEKGGTKNTVEYAKKQNVEVINIV